MNTARSKCLLCLGLFFLAQSGCGPQTASVSGTVSLGGKQVVWGTVNLQSEAGVPYQGTIKPNGTYEITNVPMGKYEVMIVSPEPPTGNFAPRKKGLSIQSEAILKEQKELHSRWFAIPEKYTEYAQSGLTLQINQPVVVFDITMTQD